MDYSFFDALIDAVFVINDARGVVYCNESAAKLCDTSVKRLARGKPLFDVIEFSDTNIFLMPNGVEGRDSPLPYVEIKFKLKAGKEGKVQIAISPFVESSGDKRWIAMVRDVTLEEVLHAKYHKQLEEKEVYIQQLQDAQKQLEAYSKNLEQMVEARTQEVKRANIMLNAIMNSLGQGFLAFSADGTCSNIYTRACESILETVPADKKIWDVLKVKPTELDTFKMWISAMFTEQLPFESLKELGPNLYPHSQNRHIILDYFPLRSDEGKTISNMVVVATDQTSEFEANKALEREKKYAKMVIKLVSGKKQFRQFVASTAETIENLNIEFKSTPAKFDLEDIFRRLHTLEGEAGIYFATEIWSASREAQEILETARRGEKVEVATLCEGLRPKLKNLKTCYDQFIENNKELFAVAGITDSERIEVSLEDVEELGRKLRQYGLTNDKADDVVNLLLYEPLLDGLRHYQDVVQNVAQKLNRKVAPIKFDGGRVKGFLPNYADLFATFVHVFRNIVDHGIEPSEEREMMGKPAAGQIHVQLSEMSNHGGRWFRFEVSDDGQGISADRLRKKLSSTMTADEVAAMNPKDLIQKIFDSGITTKDEVGEFSGRGVGLNAVKSEAEKLGGKAWVETEVGQWTKLIIEIPDLPRVARQKIAA
jgi:two-component system, chemotaxis family, sensor kinase CheA